MVTESVVVATDGSDHADKAVRIGAILAARDGARFALVHVATTRLSDELRRMVEVEHLTGAGPPGGPPLVGIPDEIADALRDASLHDSIAGAASALGEQVLARASRLAEEAGVSSPATSLRHGDAVQQILDFGRERRADLLVLGTRGRGPWGGALLGSVSSRVSHEAACTCITVK